MRIRDNVLWQSILYYDWYPLGYYTHLFCALNFARDFDQKKHKMVIFINGTIISTATIH